MNKAFKTKPRTYLMASIAIESSYGFRRGLPMTIGNKLSKIMKVIDDNTLIIGVRVR